MKKIDLDGKWQLAGHDVSVPSLFVTKKIYDKNIWNIWNFICRSNCNNFNSSNGGIIVYAKDRSG